MVSHDERHSSSEVLRELGGIYVAARQYADARNELAIYIERRPYDPEGLYYYGQALEGLGDTAARPRRLRPRRGGRPHRAALPPPLHRPLEPPGPKAARPPPACGINAVA